MRSVFDRRRFLSALAAGATVAASPRVMARGRLRQGLTPHLFSHDIDDTCRMACELGIQGLDFVSNPADWPTLKRYGLTMTVLRVDYGGGISTLARAPAGPPGWNTIGTPDQDGRFEAALRERIDVAGQQGIPNIIVTCGVRGNLGYEEGKRNAIAFLQRVRAQAEARGVTLVMENINSGHTGGPPAPPGSMFDHLAWGLDVVTQVNSPRVKPAGNRRTV